MARYLFTIYCCLAAAGLSAQIGGTHVYEFLNLSASPRITALGGHLITVQDSDISLAFHNPASLNPQMDDQLAFNTEFYLGGITHGYAAYGFRLPKSGLMMHGGIKYLSYGEFDARDAQAVDLGTFRASEYALTAGVGKQVSERLSAGANFKLITSQLEGFNSTGFSLDLAGMYQDTASRFAASLVFKNVGAQITPYADTRESIPFQIEAGFSKKLKHLPFRLSVIAIHLERWNILYDDPDAKDDGLLFGNEPTDPSAFAQFTDNLFRHLVFSGEFLFGAKENFQLRIGYNHLRRAELNPQAIRSMAGFSTGLGFKIKRFRFDYGMSFYGVGTSAHHLGIATNFKEFRR